MSGKDLYYIKPTYVDLLKNSININDYKSKKNEWINKLFEGKDFLRTLDRSISTDIILNSENNYSNDFENVKIIHSKLRYFEPRILANEAVWVYLTHIKFWDYMTQRWIKDDITKSTILDRFFLAGTDDRAMLRNGIARLWIIGHLTYDQSLEDPYFYTKILMTNQEVLTQLSERPTLFRNRNFRTAILNIINEDTSLLERAKLRKLLIQFIYLSGIKKLDIYSPDELENMIKNKI